MNLNNYLEALSLSRAKEYTRGWNKNRLKEWFGDEYRIYIPLNKDLIKITKSPIQKKIEKELKNSFYEIKNYQNGIALDKQYNREIKIGKLLNKLGFQNLLKEYNNDPTRTSAKQQEEDLLVVISRHPYDIAGQSTGRGWTSCKNLDNGCNMEYVKDESKGNLIAYLIKSNDKNINKPIARIMIVPFYDNNLNIKFVPEPNVYGSAGKYNKAFKETVNQWLQEKQGVLSGKFKASNFSYLDRLNRDMVFFDTTKPPEWIKEHNKKDLKFKYIDNEYIDNNKTIFIWENGTWLDGVFGDKDQLLKVYWNDGTFKNGTFLNSYAFGGIFENVFFDNASINKTIIINCKNSKNSIFNGCKIENIVTYSSRFHDCKIDNINIKAHASIENCLIYNIYTDKNNYNIKIYNTDIICSNEDCNINKVQINNLSKERILRNILISDSTVKTSRIENCLIKKSVIEAKKIINTKIKQQSIINNFGKNMIIENCELNDIIINDSNVNKNVHIKNSKIKATILPNSEYYKISNCYIYDSCGYNNYSNSNNITIKTQYSNNYIQCKYNKKFIKTNLNYKEFSILNNNSKNIEELINSIKVKELAKKKIMAKEKEEEKIKALEMHLKRRRAKIKKNS